ncbi:septum formation protein Maf [Niabella ginsenosidivorans]|uniref:dTTP/UTP pyrophosphatase n=1 Tax=Niabella ginsenosidivorans TaxID=1176587 RepID=A0A1A9I106_9BACT|nr:Maf family protein [Niabella ginsenosidivorans]ANH81015.1 septum formation protein Maf [Niabella ginsenosidivorans]
MALILASSSPRRKQLLEMADLSFRIITKETDETFDPALELNAAVADVAKRKGYAITDQVTAEDIIIAADTIVVLEDRVIGKPETREAAIDILTRLQGATHYVITGVALLKGKEEVVFSERTEVLFHPLTPQQITYYVDKYQPFDKAGAYAIQEWIGVTGIKRIQGDFYNVMGLPVSRVLQEIRTLGYRSDKD